MSKVTNAGWRNCDRDLPVIKRNALVAQHESILTAMASSTNMKYNELAWRRILRSREQNVSDGRIRQLRLPQLNIDASSYIDLIDWTQWTDTIVAEPFFTAFVTSNDVRKMIKSNTISRIKTPGLSCHTQSVERHIKLVSEASSLVCDHASRKELTRNKLALRATMPCFDTKF